MKAGNGAVQGVLDSPRVQALREQLDRFGKSAAGRYWSRLSTADFMNSSFAFAALAVLSVFARYGSSTRSAPREATVSSSS
jgi:hypothetical protein